MTTPTPATPQTRSESDIRKSHRYRPPAGETCDACDLLVLLDQAQSRSVPTRPSEAALREVMERNGLPERVVVGSNGAYWREYPDGYSMCPVSTDNDPIDPIAVYVFDRTAIQSPLAAAVRSTLDDQLAALIPDTAQPTEPGASEAAGVGETDESWRACSECRHPEHVGRCRAPDCSCEAEPGEDQHAS